MLERIEKKGRWEGEREGGGNERNQRKKVDNKNFTP